VRRNYELPPSDLKSSAPNLEEFRRNTAKRNHNEEKSANFIPVFMNQELLVKSCDRMVSVPVNCDKKENGDTVFNDSVLRKCYKNNIQHRLIMIGDGHIKGIAANIKSLPEDNFEAYGLVKLDLTPSHL
jgi:uncharacterized protein (DUF1015 family)